MHFVPFGLINAPSRTREDKMTLSCRWRHSMTFLLFLVLLPWRHVSFSLVEMKRSERHRVCHQVAEKHSCNLNGIGGPFFWSVPKSIEGKLGTMDTGHPLRLPAINAQKAFRSGTHLGSEAVRRTFFFPIYSFCEGNGDDGPIVKVQLNDEQTVDKSLST